MCPHILQRCSVAPYSSFLFLPPQFFTQLKLQHEQYILCCSLVFLGFRIRGDDLDRQGSKVRAADNQ